LNGKEGVADPLKTPRAVLPFSRCCGNSFHLPNPKKRLFPQENKLMADKMDFIARIEGLRLSPDVRAEIASKIQAVVMRELGKIDMRGERFAYVSGPGGGDPPGPRWNGIMVRNTQIDDTDIVFEITP
jgi:hypothetical protein